MISIYFGLNLTKNVIKTRTASHIVSHIKAE
jgi:hypothetical protein